MYSFKIFLSIVQYSFLARLGLVTSQKNDPFFIIAECLSIVQYSFLAGLGVVTSQKNNPFL